MFHNKIIENIEKKTGISMFHEILFYLLIFCIPFQIRTLFNPDQSYIDWSFNYHLAFFFYFTDILLIAFLVSWVTTEKIQWKKILTDNWTICLLFLAVMLSLFRPILETLFHYGAGVKHIEIGLYQAIKWFELLGFTLYVSQNIKKISQYKLIFGILSISGLFQALLAIFQFSSQHSMGFKWLGEYLAPLGTSGLSNFIVNGEKIIRAYGTFPHPNILAGFLLVSLASTLYLISSSKYLKFKFLYGLVSIIIIFGLFYTFSRIAWILSILMLLLFLMFHVKQLISNKKISTELAIIALIIIVSCGTLLATQKNLLFTRSFESDGQISLDSRVFYNNLALESINGKYILGLGVGNYIPKIRDMFHMEPWQYQPPHNIFLFILVELGMLGLIAFCLVIAQALSFTRARRNFSEGGWNLLLFDTLFLISSILIVIGLFDHYLITIQQGRLLLFLIIGMLFATRNLKVWEK